jgi:hypothetical protein
MDVITTHAGTLAEENKKNPKGVIAHAYNKYGYVYQWNLNKNIIYEREASIMKKSYFAILKYVLILLLLMGCTKHLQTNDGSKKEDIKPTIN